jgi:hypothetical protein
MWERLGTLTFYPYQEGWAGEQELDSFRADPPLMRRRVGARPLVRVEV